MMANKRLQIVYSVAGAALLWFFLIFLGQLLPADSNLYRVVEALGGTTGGFIQALIYAVFIFSLFELSRMRTDIRRQNNGFQLGLLPEQDQLVLTPDEVAEIKLQAIQLERAGQQYLVGELVKKTCTQYRNDQSIGETLQVFNAQVDNSKEEREGQLEVIRYLLGAIISLGFIGTLLGLSSSIGMAHLAKTAEGMPQVTGALNLAFDTTLVALLVGLVLNFFYHRYLKEMDTFYSRARGYVIDNLISRIYKPVGYQVEV
jgi:biopolymer transport protein ExbB/TolQ